MNQANQSSNSKIKTIIFDLSEVYLKGYYLVEEKLESLLNLKSSEIHQKLRERELEEHFDLLMKGKLGEEEFWQKVKKFHNWQIPTELFKKAVRDNFEEIAGTRAIIEKLNKQGYKLGLLSNHCKEWIGHCEKKFDYHKLFHSTLYSFEIGICKPDKRAYEKILSKLGAKPEECLFVDDSQENIKGAEELSIRTILFKNSNQLVQELNNLGITL
jgi:putative hydrolase of the HAD superfamily